jgi:hypothetical protein
MTLNIFKNPRRLRRFALLFAIISVAALTGVLARTAQGDSAFFLPGNLVVSRSVYVDTGTIVQGTTVLPPACSPANCPTPVIAVTDGTYPYVFNNDLIDGSFGITSKIYLDQLTPAGALVDSLEVPNSSQNGVPPTKDQMVTSFSSKSEMALNLSTDDNYLTFMGYLAPIGAIDISNSNTPAIFDPSNPDGLSNYRVVAQVDQHGKFHFTKTNSYSGNNGRAAILNNSLGANLFYLSGNAGNGGNPQPDGIIAGAGAQIVSPEIKAEVAQTPGVPMPVASFNITQLGDAADKIGKDTNFRGLTIFNNVLYYTKGSGGNGINTVYFVDTTGNVCSDSTGVGLPSPGASLPTSPLAYDPAALQTKGLDPNNMCILKGFPTALKSKTSFPFGIWFASPTVLYVADEGTGYAGGLDLYSQAAAQTTAGLQKWVFGTPVAGQWNLAYTLNKGLGLGVPYTVTGYPTGMNLATCVVGKNAPNPNNCPVSKTLSSKSPFLYSAPDGLPWSPAADGLRNITGVVNSDGTATIYGVTSTISGNGDQGADPNQLVAITDNLSATTLPSTETFSVLKTAAYGEVLRGVSWTPGSAKH